MRNGLSESGGEDDLQRRWHIHPGVLLESAPNTWLLVDEEGTIVMANSAIARWFGYDPLEVAGQKIELLIPEDLRAGHVALRREFMRAPVRRAMGRGARLLARRKDGSVFPADIVLSPIKTEEGTFILAIVRDMTDRLALEDERNQLKAQLERQKERERIGMDLHDGVMQEIYAVGLTLELALVELDHDVEAARRGVERAIEQLHKVIRNIRSYIFDLRPREFTGDLETALHDLAREFQQNSQIVTTARIEGSLPPLDMEQALTLYHIAHEALSNVQKHAGASCVQILAHCREDSVQLEVKDDGRGFDPSLDRPEEHRGMRNMAARARTVGAAFRVESSPGRGASILVDLPVRHPNEAAGEQRQAS